MSRHSFQLVDGLTTNAIDLTKLRVPGSSIREALVPAQQVTVSGYLDGGVSYETYAQFGETHVEVDRGGSTSVTKLFKVID